MSAMHLSVCLEVQVYVSCSYIVRYAFEFTRSHSRARVFMCVFYGIEIE